MNVPFKQAAINMGYQVGNILTARDATYDVQGRAAAFQQQTFQTVTDLARELVSASPRHSDPRRLLAYGYKGYSQGDEDGIIDEIVRRVGTTNRFFVEFGAGDGLENNTAALLLAGWSGAWLEGSDDRVSAIHETFGSELRADRLRVRQAFITAENIESLFDDLGVPSEPDLVSIDIDNNDYWIWRALSRFRPRVMVIEYNAAFGRSARCVVPYRPNAVWNERSHSGASLGALEALGREKGYSLVGCCFQGTNAFFVRDDLLGDHFCAPYTAANHYEPMRYQFAWYRGHPAGWGDVEQV